MAAESIEARVVEGYIHRRRIFLMCRKKGDAIIPIEITN